MAPPAPDDAPARIRLLVGLGNPGTKYEGTRHNAGREVVARVAERMGDVRWRDRFGGRCAEVRGPAGPLVILMPETFMNLSGDAAGPAAGAFRIPPDGVLAVHDEVDLPFGTVRGKIGGGTAGHNGVRSLRAGLGSADFARVRVGVGKPPPQWRGDGASWVLARFSEPAAEVDELLARAVAMTEMAIAEGMDAAIAHFHARPAGARATERDPGAGG